MLILFCGYGRKVCSRMATISLGSDHASVSWSKTWFSSSAQLPSSDTAFSPSREITVRRGKSPKRLSSSCRQSPKTYCRKICSFSFLFTEEVCWMTSQQLPRLHYGYYRGSSGLLSFYQQSSKCLQQIKSTCVQGIYQVFSSGSPPSNERLVKSLLRTRSSARYINDLPKLYQGTSNLYCFDDSFPYLKLCCFELNMHCTWSEFCLHIQAALS